jgi:4-hydroxymandelate oxidase
VEEPLFITVDDYEPAARSVLPPDVYDYLAGGAGDEWSVAENRRSFDRWSIRPRVLRASGSPQTSTNVLGTDVSMPVLVAPWAFQYLVHDEGEVATAKAAGEAGTIMVVSSAAWDRLEEIAGVGGPKWWQLYVFTDRGLTAEMIPRVAAAGYAALCMTVDFQAVGLRHRDTRSGFSLPLSTDDTEVAIDPNVSWDDLEWVRSLAPDLPLLLKGILTGEDASIALEAGVDGIVVSNHGGRQLDGVPAGITALPEVVEAVSGRVPVLVDGGVRRGTDVLKALALGAAAVMVGRPTAWGLAVGGQSGVGDVLEILRREFQNAMALSGCRRVGEITRTLVAPSPGV